MSVESREDDGGALVTKEGKVHPSVDRRKQIHSPRANGYHQMRTMWSVQPLPVSSDDDGREPVFMQDCATQHEAKYSVRLEEIVWLETIHVLHLVDCCAVKLPGMPAAMVADHAFTALSPALMRAILQNCH